MDNKNFTFDYCGKSITFFLSNSEDHIQKQILNSKNFYEIDLLEEIGRLPLKEGIFCDIGANIGNHSVYFSSVLKRDVFAFEPNKIARDLLDKNIELNDLKDKIKVFQVALGSEEAQGNMDVNISNLGASRLSLVPNGEVLVKTLDSYISDKINIALLKIDVEGFEVDVLKGAKETILKNKPLIVIETQTEKDFVNINEVLYSLNYIPIGHKGATKTVFFLHEEELEEFKKISTYLTRNDIDYAKRILHSQTDRISKSLQQLVESSNEVNSKIDSIDKELDNKLGMEHEKVSQELNKSIEKLIELQSSGTAAITAKVDSIDKELDNKLGMEHEKVSQELNKLIEKLIELQSSGTAAITAKVDSIDKELDNKLGMEYEKVSQELNKSIEKLIELQSSGTVAITAKVDSIDKELEKKLEEFIDGSKTKELISKIKFVFEYAKYASDKEKIQSSVSLLKKELSLLVELNQQYDKKIKKMFDSKYRKFINVIKNILGIKTHTYISFIDRVANKYGDSNCTKNSIELNLNNIVNAVNYLYNTLKQVDDALNGISSANKNNNTNSLSINRFSTPKGKTISNTSFVGIAAIPSREKALEKTIESLMLQADKIGVYLNGWEKIPNYLKHPKIVIARSQEHGDIGDAGKFFWIDEYEGYYFTCDDDIVYPDGYVRGIIEKIKAYKFKAVIGWHGSVIIEPFENYYTATSRRVFAFGSNRPEDTFVHILGTGTIGFHTSTIKVRRKDFKKPNMADVFFAELGQLQKVPFIIMKHEAKQMISIDEVQEDSINKHGINNIASKKNTKEYQNTLVKSIDWKLHNYGKLKVLMIGRFETFTKGGIHKSNHLIKDTLIKLGHDVVIVDSQSDDFKIEKGIDAVIVYPGDPNRPDFTHAEEKMNEARIQGIPACINISYNTNSERSREIVEKIKQYNSNKELAPAFLMTFTDVALSDANLMDIQDYIVSMPKTVVGDNSQNDNFPEFSKREGIVLGDATKLMNNDITGGDITPWITACKRLLPHVKLYVFKQYSGKFEIPGVETVPYMKEGFLDWVAQRRLFVCLNTITTFEMTPTEAQIVGTPVVYRPMPQSLSEYVGRSGVCVTSPEEFAQMCAWLYNDEFTWNSYSNLSVKNAQTNKLENLSIGLETSIRKIIFKASMLNK